MRKRNPYNIYCLLLLFTILIQMLPACVTTHRTSEFRLPNQKINLESREGLVKVIFYNTSNDVLYALTGTINIKIDGKILGTIKRDQYMQVYLNS